MSTTEQRKAFYASISSLHLTPLWEVLHALVPPQPASPCVAAHWPYARLRQHLMQAGTLITAEEAVRRVLVLENPALRGQSAITQSLYAGLQLILPGEAAPSHRHSQSALRFVVEGAGAFTAVNGERTTMHPGDFIITPSGAWHDHGSESGAAVVWLDGLDIPMLRFFDAGFSEVNPVQSPQPNQSEGASFARYGYNMAPLRGESPFGASSPIFNYPFERTRAALHALEQTTPIDAWDGYKLRYTNPLTGGWPIPTIAAFMQRLPAGFAGRPYRQTDGAVFSVVEGACEVGVTAAQAGSKEQVFNLQARDHLVIPSWHTARFASGSGCTVFSFSDRPVHQALGFHREERMQ